MRLRDALCEDPLDPHLEAVRSIPALLIWGAVLILALVLDYMSERPKKAKN